MNDDRLLMRAIDIGELLGLNDRTISRWYNKGLVVRKDIGKYCIISVFKYYRNQLLADIETLQNKIENQKKQSEKKNLQVDKLDASIRIVSSNASIKEHELERLRNNLVNVDEASEAYNIACQEIKSKSLELSDRIAEDIANTSNPSEINVLLQQQINELLTSLAS